MNPTFLHLSVKLFSDTLKFVLILIPFLLAVVSVASSTPSREIRIPTQTVEKFGHTQNVPLSPTFTIALSGGGSRGLAHIGVLKVLDEEGIKPEGIVGVSVGALIGGLYASGLSPAEIAAHLKQLDWNGLLFDEPERRTLTLARKEENSRHLLTLRLGDEFSPVVPGAISLGQRLYQQLLKLTLSTPYRTDRDWNDLKIPFQLLATDLVTGQGVVFDHGDLTPAIRGSMSIPLIFEPLLWDFLQLIDGGISSNIPVEEARSMGGAIVMAVNVSSPLRQYNAPYHPWQIVDQVTTILEQEASSRSIKNADIVVAPMLGKFDAEADVELDSLIEAGRRAMQAMLPELKEKLTPEPMFDDSLFLPIKEVILSPYSRLNLELIVDKKGQSGLSLSSIRDYLHKILRAGTLNDAYADYDSSQSRLTIHVEYNAVIENIVVVGNSLITEDEIDDIFQRLRGKRFSADSVTSALEDVMKLYRSRGYPVAIIKKCQFNSDDNRLQILIDEGHLKGLSFVGLNRISGSWLSREVPLKVGEPITDRGIMKGMSNLYATGLFRNVYPTLLSAGQGGWKIVIHVSEHSVPLIRFGMAYLEQVKTRGFVEVTYPGLHNYAEQLSLFTSVGQFEGEHRVTLLADKVFGRPVTYSLSLGYRRDDRIKYNSSHESILTYTESRWGGSLEVGVPAFSWGLGVLTSRWEKHENTYPSGSEHQLSAFGARLALDTQDRYPYPNNGLQADVTIETAVGKQSFNRTWGKWESFFTPMRRHTFGIRFSGAVADGTTPLNERFRLGGMHSFPGLKRDELVGASRYTSGVEYRFDLISRILADSYIGLRYDVGGSWEVPQDKLEQSDWLRSLSVYFAFDTLVGPLHFQWGYLYPSNRVKSANRFDIQIGNRF